MVRDYIAELDATPKGKGVRSFIAESGCADSAVVVSLLVQAVERLQAKAAMKSKKG
jgi:hypothetical protein